MRWVLLGLGCSHTCRNRVRTGGSASCPLCLMHQPTLIQICSDASEGDAEEAVDVGRLTKMLMLSVAVLMMQGILWYTWQNMALLSMASPAENWLKSISERAIFLVQNVLTPAWATVDTIGVSSLLLADCIASDKEMGAVSASVLGQLPNMSTPWNVSGVVVSEILRSDPCPLIKYLAGLQEVRNTARHCNSLIVPLPRSCLYLICGSMSSVRFLSCALCCSNGPAMA